MYTTDVITFYGETDGTNVTGTFALASEAIAGSVTTIRLDKGLKAKIWAKEISGEPVTVKILFTDDSTATTPTWIVIDTETLASPGQINLEKRKPRIIYFRTGKEAIRFDWSQTTAGKSYITVEIEIEEIK